MPGARLGRAVRVIGATLVVDNPGGSLPVTVEATFLGDASSAFTNELYLDAPSFLGPIFSNKTTPVGATASLGSFSPDVALFIRNQFLPSPIGGPASFNGWFTGNGSVPLNPDHLPHAVFEFDPDDLDAGIKVSFEDQFGGGDNDFNDAVYSFTGVRAQIVDVALAPELIPSGDVVSVGFDEQRSMAEFEGFFSNEGEIQNDGSVFNYGSSDNFGTFRNGGELLNDLAGTFVNDLDALLENSGIVRSYGEFSNEGGAIDNTGEIQNGGTWSNVSGKLANSGTLLNIHSVFENQVDGTVTSSGAIKNTGQFANAGNLTNESGAVFETIGEFLNSGTFRNAVGGIVSSSGQSRNTGQIQNAGDLGVLQGELDNALTIFNELTGTLRNLAAGTAAGIRNSGRIENEGEIENSGSVEVTPTGTVTGSGTYTQTGSSTLMNGLMEAGLVELEGGLFSGSGQVKAPMQVGPDATVAPGNSPGKLILDGDLQFDGGFLAIELDSPALHDVLEITGEAVFDGGTVRYEFATAPSPDDRFTFLTAAGGITGAETLDFTFLGDLGGLSFTTEINSTNLTLVGIPEPGTLALLASGLAVLASARARGVRRQEAFPSQCF